MPWTTNKPDKDGLWLWRLLRRKESDGIGVILVEDGYATEMTWTPLRKYTLDQWYKMGQDAYGVIFVEVLYVDGALNT